MRTGVRSRFLAVWGLVFTASTMFPLLAQAQGTGDAGTDPKITTEPVLRVSRNLDVAPGTVPGRDSHPLDPAIRMAYDGLAHMQRQINDYTATLVKRERIDGVLGDEEYMNVKVRNARTLPGVGQVPFSIYICFTQPESFKGREVIWVEGSNDNKLIAHDTGLIRGQFRVSLDPEGGMAMRGNRYPIYEAGIENLVVKLIEKAERDREAGHCHVAFYNSRVEGRDCTMIEVRHDERRSPYDFHLAKVYIDKELGVPIRYAAYSWPTRANGEPILEEEYTYVNIRLNVGLTNRDFDPDNPAYAFP